MSELYYHFVGANKRLRFDMESVEVGQTLHFHSEPILGERGFHASERPLEALKHAPSDAEWLCGVRLGGTVIHGHGESVATELTVVWILNVRKLLVEFALWNVDQAFHAIRKIGIEPDKRSIEAIRVLRLWLADKAAKEELIAAADAARAAADAAYADADDAYAADAAYADAAYAAARAADAAARAVDAAANDAYAAVRILEVVARCLDVVAAYGSTYYAARESQNEQLEKMIRISKGA
jgi:hypothetical protein